MLRTVSLWLISSLIFIGSGLSAHAEMNFEPNGSYDPLTYLDQKIEKIAQYIENRKPAKILQEQSSLEIATDANRNAWLKQLYKHDLVEASEFTRMTSDKLIMWSLIKRYLDHRAEYFHPKTMGLKKFMKVHNLVNEKGEITASREQFKAAMKEEFPGGNIIKPAAGINSQGKSKGFYFKMDQFLDDLLANDSELYQPNMMFEAYVSDLLGKASSGEMLVLQENIITAAGMNKEIKAKGFTEVRVHSFEDKVIKDGTFPRWADAKGISEKELDKASSFVQEFLSSLHYSFTSRQGFGFDVGVLDNGVLRIIDINTNRGRPRQWSGYQPRPNILGAYTRHIETNYPVEFKGWDGFLLRNDLANIKSYLKKKYIDGIR